MRQDENVTHMNATHDDLAGNQGIGRYVIVPGSMARAKQISAHFDNVRVNEHPRGHHLYMGTYQGVDVASVSTGMGCSSADIILNELYMLGAKRFLRVGTAGSMQGDRIKIGDIVVATAAVRDEMATRAYATAEVPAVASWPMLQAIEAARTTLDRPVHFGTVHCKASYHGRQLGMGPLGEKNKQYLEMIRQNGILATEMETALLYILSNVFNQQSVSAGDGPVYAGGILAIAGDGEAIGTADEIQAAEAAAIQYALDAVVALNKQEKN